MGTDQIISRRKFLRYAGLTVAGATLAACAPQPAAVPPRLRRRPRLCPPRLRRRLQRRRSYRP